METKFTDLFAKYLSKVFDKLYPTNFTYDIVNEYTNRSDVDCLVVIKQLTPTFQHDIKNIPYQLIIECNNQYVEGIKKELDELAVLMDAQTSQTFAEALNDLLEEQEQYDVSKLPNEHYLLSGCSVLGTFIDKGLYQATDLTMSINVIVATGYYDISDVTIDGQSIDCLNFAFTYAANPDKTAKMNNDGKMETTNLTADTSYLITTIPNAATNSIVTNMILCQEINKLYLLKFKLNNVERSIKAVLVNGGIAKPLGSISTLQLSFMVKEW